jgi:hypothetical protein
MARIICSGEGWSAMNKAALHRYLTDRLQTPGTLSRLVEGLQVEERQALSAILEGGGSLAWTEFDARYGNDLEESPYWQYHESKTLMGRLRARGLVVEATADNTLYLTIPVELRALLLGLLQSG